MGFLTSHARMQLGWHATEGAAGLGITERSTHGIVTGPAQADYMVKRSR
jgi:hypothetical protein